MLCFLILIVLSWGPIVQAACAQTHLWSHRYGSSLQDYGLGITVDDLGNVFLLGLFTDNVNFGGERLTSHSLDMFVAKFDSRGNHVWSQKLGELGEDPSLSNVPRGVAVDRSGNVILTGRDLESDGYVGKLDTNGDPVWIHRFIGTVGLGAAVDASGNVIATGYYEGWVNFGGRLLQYG